MTDESKCPTCQRATDTLVEIRPGLLLCEECAADWRERERLLATTPCCVCGRLVSPHETSQMSRMADGSAVVWCSEHVAQHEAEMRARREQDEREFWHPQDETDGTAAYVFLRLAPLRVEHDGELVPVVGRGTVSSVEPPGVEDQRELIGLSIEEAADVLESRGWRRGIAQWRVGAPEDTYSIWRFRRPVSA